MSYKHYIQKILLALCLSPTLFLHANPVDIETAKNNAVSFLQMHSGRTTETTEVNLRLHSANTYLFENENQFVLVAADDELPTILGYGVHNGGNIPDAIRNYVKALKSTPQYKTDRHIEPIAPLLPFVRHQRAPYNNHCPFYKTNNGEITPYRCVVGCVATALEEIISYYRREVVLADTLHGWKTTKYEIPDVLPGTTINCQLIRNNYDVDDYTPKEADEVARLSYYCGVAAHMNWGIEESGANIVNLLQPLREAFGYGYVEYVDSYKYAPQDWTKIITQEIVARRPVLYAAFNMWLSGHAFAIDGLDENGLFHVNWGYGGSYDGFFRLDVLNYNEPPNQMTPEGMEAGFFSNHQAILLHPDSVEVSLPDTLARTGREIAIDSVVFHLAPESGKHTPLSLYVHNTTNHPLTTPLELITNTEQDTAIFKQADYVALGTCTLAPRESKVLKIHASFNKEGNRHLRVTPDEKVILYKQTVSIEKGKSANLLFQEPQITLLPEGRLCVSIAVSNCDTAGRSGQEVLYELGEGKAETMKDGVRHSRHLYIQPGATVVDTAHFDYLKSGHTYTLLIRSPWKIQVQKTFDYSNVSKIKFPLIPTAEEIKWYTIDGRPISQPRLDGIYLRYRNMKYEKIYYKK